MSIHYTPSRPMPLWYLFLGNVFIPVCLIMATSVAWSDGPHDLALLLTFLTDLYIVFRFVVWLARGRVVETWLRVIAMQMLFYCLYLLHAGQSDPAVIISMEITGMLCLSASFTAEHHRRIAIIELPTGHDRAADFPGIYRITCLSNGKQYIGQTSQTINDRWSNHRMMLHSQRHHNRWLQADWNLYRPEQFKWEVLEVVTDPVWLLDRERAWQDVDYDANKRYNPPNIAPRIAKASRRPSMKRKLRS